MKKLSEGYTEIKTVLSEEIPKKYGIVFLIIVICAFLAELFVFNFKWVNSVFDKPLEISARINGAVQSDDGSIVINSDTASFEFNDINKELKYLYFCPGRDSEKARITVSAQDEANSRMLSAPERTVLAQVKQSQYIRLHFSGEIKNLKIEIRDMMGKSVDGNSVTLNAKVPLMFSFGRFAVLTLLLMLLFVIRPKSFIYGYRTNLKSAKQKAVVVAVFVLQACLLFNMIHWNTTNISWYRNAEHHRQYYSLIDAFKAGHLYLNDEPSETLKNMDNPYDTTERARVGAGEKWDHAYYNGKYYVYFGVVPALLLYLPYNLITGQDLPNYIAAYILSLLIMAGILMLLWEIIKKWYKNTPFAIYLIIYTVFAAVSALGYAVYKPDFYIVPGMSAVAFGLFGLAFWLSAEKNDGMKTYLAPKNLAGGSVCIALIAGCRPQLLLAIAFGIMLFWDKAFKERELFSKKGLKQTLAVVLPFVVIGLLTMWYNYARFGSPFDFGANYNLTTNDMTQRGFVWGRTGLGIFSYLFQPVRLEATFPFLKDFQAQTAYQGLTLTEMMIGGVYSIFPILIIGLYGAFKKNSFGDKRAYRIVYYSVIMSVIIAVLDAQMAGLLTRYFNDFVWILMIGTAITVFAYYDMLKDDDTRRSGFIKLVGALSLISLVFVFLRIFAHSEDSIKNANPLVYYTMQHLIAFWL